MSSNMLSMSASANAVLRDDALLRIAATSRLPTSRTTDAPASTRRCL